MCRCAIISSRTSMSGTGWPSTAPAAAWTTSRPRRTYWQAPWPRRSLVRSATGPSRPTARRGPRPAWPSSSEAGRRGATAEEGVEVASEGRGVGGRAVDVGGGAGAEDRQAEHVESGGFGDHAAVVADAAFAVTDGDVEPGVVGKETRGPQHRGDLAAGQVEFQGGTGVDAGGCEPVRCRQLIVQARRGGPLVGPGQEPVHLQVGESAGVGECPGELSYPVGDTAEAARQTDPDRGQRVEVRRGSFGGPGELGRGEVAGPGEVVDLVVAFGEQAGGLQPPEDVPAAVGAGQPDVLAGRQGHRAAGPVDLGGELDAGG